MKELMEEWRKFLKEVAPPGGEEVIRADLEKMSEPPSPAFTEQEDLQTIGDLKKLIAQAKRLKNTEAMKGKLGSLLKSVLTAGAADLISIARSTYHLPDDVKLSKGLSWMNVDDQVSAIVDDNLENDFLKTLEAELQSGRLPDDTPLGNLDMTKLLANFIQHKHDKRTVVTPEVKP